jgi:hypothetical protein
MIRLTTVGIVGALAACVAGCSGTPPGAFIIVQNQVPGADCSVSAAKGSLYQGEGIVDLSIARGYELFPLLENDFPGPNAGQTVDGNRIALGGFDVEVGLPGNFESGPIAELIQNMQSLDANDPQKTLVAYSTITSGSVASGGGNTSSHVNVLPGDLIDKIRALGAVSVDKTYWIEVSVRARGSTLAQDVQSDAFHYPIQLCDGCLAVDVGQCTGVPAASSCTPGQDEFVRCCENAGKLVCR